MGVPRQALEEAYRLFYDEACKRGMDHEETMALTKRIILVTSSFLLLVVRHLLLEAMHLFLVAYC